MYILVVCRYGVQDMSNIIVYNYRVLTYSIILLYIHAMLNNNNNSPVQQVGGDSALLGL